VRIKKLAATAAHLSQNLKCITAEIKQNEMQQMLKCASVYQGCDQGDLAVC
jgi:hypothetical protein